MNSLNGHDMNKLAFCSLKVFLVILLVLIVYIPAMNGEFVWDDHVIVRDNLVLQPGGLSQVWLTTQSVNYWPATWTFVRLEYELWGLNPTGYHVANILLHLVSSLLIWRILVLLHIPGAWLTTLIFAIHPVNVESVAWITQQKTLLSLLFFSGAILFYLQFESSHRRISYLLSVICFLLAMLSKATAVSLPLVLLLIVWWKRGAICRHDLLRNLPYFAIAVVMGVVELWFQSERAIGDAVVREDGFAARLAGAGWTVWFYLYKAVLPVNLSFIYPRWNIDPTDWQSYAPGLLLLGVLVVCWRFREDWGRPVLFALSYFIITLGPVLGFADFYYLKFSFVADHYQYYSMSAIIALVVSATYVTVRKLKRTARLARIMAVVIIAAHGAITFQQCTIYQNKAALWSDTIKKNPFASIAHYNLGWFRHDLGQLDNAMHHYQKALKIDPEYVKAHYNIGLILESRGQQDKAIHRYRRALEIDDEFVDAQNNLGKLLAKQGSIDRAIFHLERVLEIRPNYANAFFNLAKIFNDQGQNTKSIRYYMKVLEFSSVSEVSRLTLTATYTNLGKLTLSDGQFTKAINHFRKALNLSPNSAESHIQLAIALTSNRQFKEAEQHLLQTLTMAPKSPEAHNGLGVLYLKTNRPKAAIKHFRKALRLNPDYQEARQNLDRAQKNQNESTKESVDSQ